MTIKASPRANCIAQDNTRLLIANRLTKRKAVKRVNNYSAENLLPKNQNSTIVTNKPWNLSNFTKIVIKHLAGNIVKRISKKNIRSKNECKRPCNYCISLIQAQKTTMSILSKKKNWDGLKNLSNDLIYVCFTSYILFSS